jgi:hypothetical protein
MLVLCEEFTLCLCRLRVGKALLILIQSKLVCRRSYLELGSTEQTLSPGLNSDLNRYLLCQSIFFVVPFLSHIMLDLMSASNRDHFLRLHFEVSYWCLSEIKRRLMIPGRLLILELLEHISLHRDLLPDFSSLNVGLD